MIKQNFQSVLFIDDRVSRYLSSLKPAAEAAGYELYSTDNVLDGLDFLKTYNDSIYAVILDLNFPKGEIQGLEAIKMIKELQPNLPIIMLTDSDSAADIDRVVACMRKGAYNYIGKRTLNPVYLFQVVEKAISESKLLERIRVKNTISEKTHRFFTVKENCDYSIFTYSGIFGFRLISLNKADDLQEVSNLEKVAMQWHENLIKSLSTIYCDEIQVNIKYIAENYKLNCYIIFTVYGKSDDDSLNATINNLQHDISEFFSPSQSDYSQPYIFEEICDSDYLLNANKPIEGEKEIRINNESLARHLYIMGQTGTGKSTMLKTMISDCLDKNYGFTIIDPHGDLYNQVLNLIPKNKKNRLFLLDTSDSESSIKLNPLLYDKNMPQAKSLVINEILRAFYSIYDNREIGGPMFETYFKNGLLLIMDEKVEEKYGKGTLENLLTLFYNEDYRKERLMVCGDKNITDFFKIAETRYGENNFENVAFYITSKLTRFIEDYYLAPILTSKTNNVDFRNLIDNGNILLVKMDKGLIGTDNTSLLGQLILSKLFLAGMSRSNINIDERKPHYIFIDEFQNFVKGDVGSALSEVRKYGLNLILANQTLGQLDDYLIQSLLGNVGSLVFFRPGIFDYEKLKYYIEPNFKREDVLKLPNFNCIARILIDNIPSDPFVFQTKNI